MTISSRITALVTTIAADIKDLYSKYVNLADGRVIYLPTLQLNINGTTSTVFVSYTPGLLRVFKSGVLLRSGVDYTATNGSSIVFTNPLQSGDELDVERISVDSGDQPTLNEIFTRTGSLGDLVTVDKSSLVAAINEIKSAGSTGGSPSDLWTVIEARSTAPSTAVTLGSQVPGAPNGIVFTIGDFRLHTVTGDIYIVQTGGVVALHSAMPDNSERTVHVTYGSSSASNTGATAGTRFYKKTAGVLTDISIPLYSTNAVLHTGTGDTFATPLHTAIGGLSQLTTTIKTSIVAAINELKTGLNSAGSPNDIHTVVNAVSSSFTTAVTIGAQIPGAPTGVNYTAGQFRLDTNTGDIYVIQAGGTVALQSAMPDNSERTVTTLYGNGVAGSLSAGTRFYKRVSGVTTSLPVPSTSTNAIYHFDSGSGNSVELNTVLGTMSSLTTSNKTNFVSAINEVITNKGISTNTDTTTTTGFTNPTLQFTTQRYDITANATGAIRYGGIRKYEYLSNFNNTTGKNAASLDWYSHLGSGTIGDAIAHESRVSAATGATITRMTGSEAVLTDNLSTINTLYLNRSSIETNGGTITTAKGYSVDKISSAGTLSSLVGFEFGDLSTLTSTTRWSFINLDPGAPVVSAAPVVDQSIVSYTPTSNNFSVTIAKNIQYVRLNPVAVYGNIIINLPPFNELINGQMVYITTSKEVKNVTWVPGVGASVVNAPTSLDAGQTVVFKYHSAQTEWVCMSVTGTGAQSVNKAPVLNELLIYYGYPISYKGINTTAGVIADIAARYKYWVVGDTYGDPLHESYADTTTIIAGVRALGVIVYGYVPIGQNTSNLTITQIRTKIDQWSNLGVDGIFLDEFGFDYANTRTRQIDCVNYVHGKGLPYCANAWTVEDFCYDNINQVPWPSGDWRYINFTTYNPTNLVLPRNPTDSYLFENFGFSNLGIAIIWDAQERSINVKNLSITRNFKVWVEAVFGETVPGTLDTTKLGDFTSLEEAGAYVSANAYIYGFDVVGGGGFSFGSNGTPVEMPLYALPAEARAATVAQSTNFTTMEAVRYFGDVTVKVINTATDQRVVISSVSNKVLQGTYPDTLIDEITVSTTAPLNPKINQLWLDIS